MRHATVGYQRSTKQILFKVFDHVILSANTNPGYPLLLIEILLNENRSHVYSLTLNSSIQVSIGNLPVASEYHSYDADQD